VSDQVTAVAEDPTAVITIKLEGVTDPDGLLTWVAGVNHVTVEVVVAGVETAIYKIDVTKS